jgi:hypothetical protein
MVSRPFQTVAREYEWFHEPEWPILSGYFISACMFRRRNVMLGISPPVIYRVTSGLDTFSSDDDSDSESDIDRDDPSNYPILWGPED